MLFKQVFQDVISRAHAEMRFIVTTSNQTKNKHRAAHSSLEQGRGLGMPFAPLLDPLNAFPGVTNKQLLCILDATAILLLHCTINSLLVSIFRDYCSTAFPIICDNSEAACCHNRSYSHLHRFKRTGVPSEMQSSTTERKCR